MHVELSRREYVTAPFGNAHHHWTSRESLLVRLVCPATGCRGLGEASPLPGFSPESLDDVQVALQRLDGTGLSFARDGDLVRLFAEAARRWVNAPPSARFALETAFLDGLCQVRKLGLAEALSLFVSASEPCVGLSHREPAHVLNLFDEGHVADALRFRERGVLVFKVKVGRDLDFESERLEQLVSAIRSHDELCMLRLDANQSLNLDQWRQYSPRWRRLPIEFLEEPCPPELLGTLLAEGSPGIPLALDETLSLGPRVLEPWLPRLAFFVCKPMYLGGFTPVLEWARLARVTHARIVVSHLLDGPVAHRMHQALAHLVAPDVAAGLAPHPGLALWADELRPRSSDWGVGLECGARV